jgi:hypothetical protein
MSKKTVTFKMPTLEAPPLEDRRGPDEWVRRGETDAAALTLSPPLPAPAPTRRVMLDLAAERDFGQVMALSVIAPPMLGWFWWLHAMNRYRQSAG